MPVACKACTSPSKGFIDGAMRDGQPYADIIAELATRGEKFNQSNLGRHKPHVKRMDDERMTAEIEESIAKLRLDAASAPAVLRPAYTTLIRFLESVSTSKAPGIREALAAAESIHRIAGMGTKQQFLLDFAERAWAPGGGMFSPPQPKRDGGRQFIDRIVNALVADGMSRERAIAIVTADMSAPED